MFIVAAVLILVIVPAKSKQSTIRANYNAILTLGSGLNRLAAENSVTEDMGSRASDGGALVVDHPG